MPDLQIEEVIFSNLIHDESFIRKSIPYVKKEYFSNTSQQIIFQLIKDYFDEYNKRPTPSALKIELENKSLNQGLFDECVKTIEVVAEHKIVDHEWLINQTEKFCQDKAIYNAIMESIQIIDNKSKDKTKGSIPSILQDALGVSFDTHIGHDFLEDAESRYEFYHNIQSRIPFDIDLLNHITRGGLPNKTLNVVLAGTGVGKTLIMCHCASNNLMDGKNVLYITLEMAEERISERIDANLTSVPIDELETLPKESYLKKLDKLKTKTHGKLIVKEYPTSTVGAAHFRHLLNELNQKRNFKPDIIYIDYINLCISSRLKLSSSVNSYTMIKAIAEELRGLAVEFNVPIFSATQTNRTGFTDGDLGLEHTSESFGLPQTADFMIAAIRSDELDDLNQIMFKQLKNRYSDPGINKRFVVGIDKKRMKIYNAEASAKNNIVKDIDEVPVMDTTDFGEQFIKRKFDKQYFEEFK